jgi:hypothetical protein
MELSKHELQFLLNSSDVDVRRNFIRHDDVTSEQLLHALQNDKDLIVRLNAISNPNITDEHIIVALDDVDYRVREQAIRNAKASNDSIQKALIDSNEMIVLLAINHPNNNYKTDEISESTKVKIYEKSIESLKGLVDIQTSDGNWNYDPYMHGMANGMILALHLFQENENGCLPDFLEAPKVWGCDKNEVHEIKQQQTQQNTCECNCRMSD